MNDQPVNSNPSGAATPTPSTPPIPPDAPADPRSEASPPKAAAITRPQSGISRSQMLPPFRVMLHNDDRIDMTFVVRSIVELTPLSASLARDIMIAAHDEGTAEVLITHKERAELYQEQFSSKGLSVTIEPAAA